MLAYPQVRKLRLVDRSHHPDLAEVGNGISLLADRNCHTRCNGPGDNSPGHGRLHRHVLVGVQRSRGNAFRLYLQDVRKMFALHDDGCLGVVEIRDSGNKLLVASLLLL